MQQQGCFQMVLPSEFRKVQNFCTNPIIAHFQKSCLKTYSLSNHKIKLLRAYNHHRNHIDLLWFGRLSSYIDKYETGDGGVQNFREI